MSWDADAICRGQTYTFFIDEHDPNGTLRATCQACPVTETCLATALKEEGAAPASNRHGYRGGATPSERHSMYRNSR